MATDPLLKKDPYSALRYPDFRIYMLTRLCITFAIQIQAAAVGWQVYQITQSAFMLGMIGLAEFVPYVSIVLFGGHVADTVNRKRIMIISLWVLFATMAAIWYFSLDTSTILHDYGPLPIYLTIYISGFARAFLWPAAFALMSQLVPKQLYPNSSLWNSTTWHISAVGGPALGGLIIGASGLSSAYLLTVICAFASLILVNFIPSKPLVKTEKQEGVVESLFTGLKFVFHNQLVLSTLTLDLFAVFFGGAVALLPIFASKEFLNCDEWGYGMLRAAPALGAIITALFIAYRPPMKNSGRILFGAVACFGLCMIFFAISRNFWLSFGLLALSGMFDNVSVVVRSTIVQLFTPDHMRGRVSSVNSIFISSSNELGEMESGVAASLMGVVPSVIFGGSMTLLVVAATAFLAPKLRKLHLSQHTA